MLPIYQSTTFKYESSEQMGRLFDLEDSGYFYTRLQNPTNDAAAAKIAALEGGEVSLEESIKLFEEGTRLTARCTKLLDEAELKVTKLLQGPDGTPVEEAMDNV